MKKIPVVLSVIAFSLLALMATNPEIEDHREAVMQVNRYQINVPQDVSISREDISRDNHILFSKTKIKVAQNYKQVGTGILGKVWLDAKEPIAPGESKKMGTTAESVKIRDSDNSDDIDTKREQTLKSFAGKYWKNTDFYIVYFNLYYIGNYSYKFKLYSDDDCKYSSITGEFKVGSNNKGLYQSKTCGKITFDLTDLFDPKYKTQPIIDVGGEKEDYLNCKICADCIEIYAFGGFWRR